MFPGALALAFNLFSKSPLKAALKPLSTLPSLKPILFSLFYPLLFILTCAVLALFTGLGTTQMEKLPNFLPQFKWIYILMGILMIWGEEYGWRGFLLPELTKLKGKLTATLITGVVWAIWHTPIIYTLASHQGVPNPLSLSITLACAVFTFSFPFAFVYYSSQSIIPPMILHWTWNLANPIILGNLYRNTPGFIDGNVRLINGEGVMGILLGLIFATVYGSKLWKEKT